MNLDTPKEAPKSEFLFHKLASVVRDILIIDKFVN
jgi:hypothetical protein